MKNSRAKEYYNNLNVWETTRNTAKSMNHKTIEDVKELIEDELKSGLRDDPYQFYEIIKQRM